MRQLASTLLVLTGLALTGTVEAQAQTPTDPAPPPSPPHTAQSADPATAAETTHPHASPAEALAAQIGDEIQYSSVPQRGLSVRWGKAVAVVDAPFATVMRIVRDYGRYSEFLPKFRQSRVLSRRGSDAMVYMEASVIRDTTTLWAQMRISNPPTGTETQRVDARMIRGNVNALLARWEVTPLAGGTRCLVTFQLLVAPKLPLPSSLFTSENVKAARKTLRALRERAQEAS